MAEVKEEIKDAGREHLTEMLLELIITAIKQALISFLPKLSGAILGGPVGMIVGIVLPMLFRPVAAILIKLGVFWNIDRVEYRKLDKYNSAWEKFKPIEAAYNGHLTEEQEKINEELDRAIDDALSWD